MQRPTYWTVHETIARYAPNVITLFADGWERFPVGPYAEMIAQELRVKLGYWQRSKTGAGAVAAITAAITEIERRAAE